MKYVLVILSALFCLQANAGARLSVQANQYDGKDGVYPIVGLSVDQVLIHKLFVTGWTGYGQRPVLSGDTKEWASGKLGLEYRFPLFYFGAGAFANTASSEIDVEDMGLESGIYAKVSMRLW